GAAASGFEHATGRNSCQSRQTSAAREKVMCLPNRADERPFRFSICCHVAIVVCAIFAAGCTVGPKYRRADTPSATTWELAEPWREGAPKDAIPKGQWWTVFRDSELEALETQAIAANQT